MAEASRDGGCPPAGAARPHGRPGCPATPLAFPSVCSPEPLQAPGKTYVSTAGPARQQKPLPPTHAPHAPPAGRPDWSALSAQGGRRVWPLGVGVWGLRVWGRQGWGCLCWAGVGASHSLIEWSPFIPPPSSGGCVWIRPFWGASRQRSCPPWPLWPASCTCSGFPRSVAASASPLLLTAQ